MVQKKVCDKSYCPHRKDLKSIELTQLVVRQPHQLRHFIIVIEITSLVYAYRENTIVIDIAFLVYASWDNKFS